MFDKAPSLNGEISSITGEFLDRGDEQRFLTAHWSELSRQFQLTLALGCLFLGLSLVIDHLSGGNEAASVTLVIAKFVTMALAALAIALAGTSDKRGLLDTTMILIAVSLAVSNVAQLIAGETAWQTLSLALVLQILFISLLVTSRFAVRAGVCAILLGAFLGTLLIVEAPAEAPETMVIQVCFCLLCLECTRRVNRSQRAGFIGEAALSKSRFAHEHSELRALAQSGPAAGTHLDDDHREAELRALRQARQQSAALVRAVFDAVAEGLCTFDQELRLTSWNRKVIELLDYPEDLLRPGLPLEDLLRFNAVRGDFGPGRADGQVEERLTKCRLVGTEEASVARDRLSHKGIQLEVRYLKCHDAPLIATISNATAVPAGRESAAESTLHDSLTGAYNRTAVQQALRREIKRCRRSSQDFWLAKVDLDDFHSLNQSHGRDSGDRVLKAVAKDLARELREIDTLGRLAKDQFIILFNGLDTEASARALAERLSARVAESRVINGEKVAVTASIAMACYPHDGLDLDQLEANLDKTLHTAKANGKQQILVAQRSDAA